LKNRTIDPLVEKVMGYLANHKESTISLSLNSQNALLNALNAIDDSSKLNTSVNALLEFAHFLSTETQFKTAADDILTVLQQVKNLSAINPENINPENIAELYKKNCKKFLGDKPHAMTTKTTPSSTETLFELLQKNA